MTTRSTGAEATTLTRVMSTSQTMDDGVHHRHLGEIHCPQLLYLNHLQHLKLRQSHHRQCSPTLQQPRLPHLPPQTYSTTTSTPDQHHRLQRSRRRRRRTSSMPQRFNHESQRHRLTYSQTCRFPSHQANPNRPDRRIYFLNRHQHQQRRLRSQT